MDLFYIWLGETDWMKLFLEKTSQQTNKTEALLCDAQDVLNEVGVIVFFRWDMCAVFVSNDKHQFKQKLPSQSVAK